jgi:small subunit ribosomal protein S6
MEIKVKLPEVKGMYETTFLSSPELSEDQSRKVAAKFEKILKDGGANIINLEHWGNRKLAYTIGKHENAWYTFVEFSAPGTLIKKLEQEYHYDEQVIRYLTTSLDKHAIAFNKKRREHGFGKNEGRSTEFKAD